MPVRQSVFCSAALQDSDGSEGRPIGRMRARPPCDPGANCIQPSDSKTPAGRAERGPSKGKSGRRAARIVGAGSGSVPLGRVILVRRILGRCRVGDHRVDWRGGLGGVLQRLFQSGAAEADISQQALVEPF